jgi:L-serine kinase (ATP) / ParB family transcriptional regulator, heme-responsive regulator
MRPARHDDFRLPDLRFVPTAALIPHEQHDPTRLDPLVQGFRQEAVLKNPPIVAPLLDVAAMAEYMVLDGANRSMAAREAGLPHIVVQNVVYQRPHVILSTWHHALAGLPGPVFEEACHSIAGLEVRSESVMHARALLARREILAYAEHEGEVATTCRGGATLEERNQLLNALVDTYRLRSRFYRTSTESFEVAKERHPDVTTLVVFPHFEPVEVMELAGSGSRLPAGITRHLIRWRALRINVPIERMADRTQSLEEKNRWLAGWLEERWAKRQVRFYEESTVLFDE